MTDYQQKIIVETDRLFIQEANLKDAPFFYELLNSPNWLEYIGNRNIHSLQEAETYIRDNLIKSYDQNGFGLYKVSLKEKNTPIGICGLLKRTYLDHPDIGFATLPAFERQGLTFEAAKGVLHYAQNKLSHEKILAITTEHNQGSQALLQKVGLKSVDKIFLDREEKLFLLFST